MREYRVIKYIEKVHGKHYDKEKSNVVHSLSGFMAGWNAAVESVLSLPPTKENHILILKHVSQLTGITILDMQSRNRKREVAEARAIFAMTCKLLIVRGTLASIGKAIDKPHDLVLHYLNVICEYENVQRSIEDSVKSYYKKHI